MFFLLENIFTVAAVAVVSVHNLIWNMVIALVGDVLQYK